jgi:hypothetical protein
MLTKLHRAAARVAAFPMRARPEVNAVRRDGDGRQRVRSALFAALLLPVLPAYAEYIGSGADAFAQLGQELPTPNDYRTASGAPGHAYWQQQADYDIKARLDEDKRRIEASARVTYRNNSPDTLRYLWLQLDQNRFRTDSLDQRSKTVSEDRVSYQNLREHQALTSGDDHGYQNLRFSLAGGEALPFTVVDTLVRLDLPSPLGSGDSVTFDMEWAFNIVLRDTVRSRGGWEQFEESDTQIFFLAQWFPRLAAYSDYEGWHNKAFLGSGEFTLEFGDYDVELTVPDNHIVSSTGELANPQAVLTAQQRKRLAAAGTDSPSFIVTPEEALANEKTEATGTKTWRFVADNVRDFAWASSSKFIWDAMVHEQPGARYDRVLAMSFYPNEAEPVWSKYSTQAVVHTMDVYSRFSFDYPYPTAQSVNTWEGGGMEYPMITFNGYRPDPPDAKEDDPDAPESRAEEQRAYSRSIKYGLIGVVIHEIGHIYFPMTVNSDERQWTWMDEGLNTFLEYVAELEWEEDFPAFRRISDSSIREPNVLDMIPEYMTSPRQVPVMTSPTRSCAWARTPTPSPPPRSRCCARRSWVASSSTSPSASTRGAGSSSVRRRRTSSAPWRTPPASTWTGSGAPGSTPRTTSTWRSATCAPTASSTTTRTSTIPSTARSTPATTPCRSTSSATAPRASCRASRATRSYRTCTAATIATR